MRCNTHGNVTDNRSVDVEQVIAGHARLARHTGGNDNDVRTLQRLFQATVGGQVALDNRGGVDVGDVRCDAGRIDDIVQCQLRDERRLLEKQR